MTAHRIAVVLAAALALAACAEGRNPGFQGWVEADLIFVSPDEYGRVETLSVREGDQVEKGAPLFTVDADLQAADVEMAKATLANAQAGVRARAGVAQDRGRHAEGLRRGGGGAAHRRGAAFVGADPADAPQGGKPGDRQRAADLLPAGRVGAGGPAGAVAAAARQHQGAVLRAGDGTARASRSASRCRSTATAARPRCRRGSPSSRASRNTRRR